MVLALILVSIGFAVTLGMLLFGSNRATIAAPAVKAELGDASKARAHAETELARKQKELDEQRAQLQDLKDQLKQTKRKLFDQKEGEKGDRDLVKARAELERNASMQLEVVRGELNQALAEIDRLRGDQGGGKGRRGPAPTAAPVAAPAATPAASTAPVTGQISAPAQEGERVVTAAVQVTPAAETAAPAPAAEKDRGVRRYRDLNDADREKMERLEQSAKKDRERAAELERELRRVKGGRETQQRIYTSTKGELDLVKDKFKALEKRLNRTLLERDLLRRAIKDLEKKTGMLADRTELTPEEVAASDQKSDEVARERANSEAQRAAQQAQAEAEAAKATEASAAASEAPAPASSEADKAPVPNA